ncbi:hypothetical protein [Sulfitobacter pacificus]|uniref:Uncharacterized protein n=1 Tax=Sulfitobacter pacificus TaxID=1499314 RepID=A0ABQ5VGA1_9RHOB|nr:hypothetical protein [Sulfitobacter pacificus]GLQ26116.1 hypothetical protein GCM10007927_09190 [Sulfitobacter pacificus]
MKVIAALGLIAVLITGCAAPVVATKRIPISKSQTATIKETTAYNLKDPGSAQFRNIRQIERTHQDGTKSLLVCGEVNGRNAFGGYVGFSTFHGTLQGRKFKLNGIGNADTNWLYVANCPG